MVGVVAAFVGLTAFAVRQSGWSAPQPAIPQANPANAAAGAAAAGFLQRALVGHGLAPAGYTPGRAGTPAATEASVTVVTAPAVKTFVYLNGGSLLGETPLRDAAIPAGRQTLTLWAPSIGGRATRRVDIKAGEKALVVENLAGKNSFAARTP